MFESYHLYVTGTEVSAMSGILVFQYVVNVNTHVQVSRALFWTF